MERSVPIAKTIGTAAFALRQLFETGRRLESGFIGFAPHILDIRRQRHLSRGASQAQPQDARHNRVFISHASADARFANRLVTAFENADIDCWIAPRDIPEGESSWGQIANAAEACSHFLLLLSEASNKSQFVTREVGIRVEADKPIFPVSLDDATPISDMRFLLAGLQWTKLTSEHAIVNRFKMRYRC